MKVIPISGTIGLDVTPSQIRAALTAARGEPLEVQISSPGGFVYEGLEIYHLIKNYQGRKTTHLMGLAASMASVIALAGDRVRADAATAYMIHEVFGGAVGTAEDLREQADVLEGFSGLLAGIYSAKTGKPIAEIREMMAAETWLFSSEARDAGFVDEIIGEPSSQARAATIASARASFAASQARVKASGHAEDARRIAACVRSAPDAFAMAPGAGDLTADDIAAASVVGMSLDDYRKYKDKTEKPLDPAAEDAAAAAIVGMSLEDYRKYSGPQAQKGL